MQYLKTYLKKITDRGNTKLAESIEKTANDVGNKHIKTFSFSSHEIGLLLGNVQSGKTGQMFGIICKAADLGFPVFVLLTTDNVVLQQQTLDRVRADLEGFCICGENDAALFAENNLMDPVIIVLKKNVRMLKLWANILNSTGLYLQVTGTPQAIFLQTLVSGWHPYFIYYFQPGDAYLGGDFFFPSSGKPDCVSFLEKLKMPMREVIVRHLLVSAQIFLAGGKVSNCLFHPSVRVAVHEKIEGDIQKELKWCTENLDVELKNELSRQYVDMNPARSQRFSLEDLYEKVKEILHGNQFKVLVMNGKNDVESSDYEAGCNFVVGGNTLGRGVTFPGLQTIYYTRTSKKPQADTMWQHSRMFGYDRDPGMMKVYIDENLYKLFADINATNNSIIAQVEKGIEDVKIYYPEGLNPTRKNVLDNDHVEIISGGTNYYPFNPDNDSIEDISKLLETFSEAEPYYQVSLRLMKEILAHIIPSADFKIQAFCSVLDTILSERPTGQGILIVRRERNIAQGTGALLSPNDWQLGGTFTDKVVLTMYQVTGTKGWGGKKLWVPNIKLPSNTMYYDVIEEDV